MGCHNQMEIDFNLENATMQQTSPIVLQPSSTVVLNTAAFRVPLETVAHPMAIA